MSRGTAPASVVLGSGSAMSPWDSLLSGPHPGLHSELVRRSILDLAAAILLLYRLRSWSAFADAFILALLFFAQISLAPRFRFLRKLSICGCGSGSARDCGRLGRGPSLSFDRSVSTRCSTSMVTLESAAKRVVMV